MSANSSGLSNPFAESSLVSGYEQWYETTGRRAHRLEKALLKHLLAHFPRVRTLLDVGCGTGHFTRWFGEQGLQAVGLDISSPMLTEAMRLASPPCIRGDTVALPFANNAFDLVVMIATIEFVSDPDQALVEAIRVARSGVILGVLNRRSLLGRKLKREGGAIWESARFFTVAELAQLVQRTDTAKGVKMAWRTTLWPLWPTALPLPWGGFIGLVVRLS